MENCLFNMCELVNGIWGFILGILSAMAFAWLTSVYTYRKHKKIYGKIEGKYVGLNDSGTEIKTGSEQSKATIEFLLGKTLKINVTHGANYELEWEGEISMEMKNQGSIVWKYVTKEIEDWYGYKKLIVLSSKPILIKLIGEAKKDYGIEIFKRID